MSWRVDWCYSAEDGITLVTRSSFLAEPISETHFTSVRKLLKHLRKCHPEREFKSEVWHYYGKNYTIKSRLKGWD